MSENNKKNNFYKIQSAGGKATAIKLRNKAIENYYKSPNFCKFCDNVIDVDHNEKVRTIKKRKFCNKSCSASYNNSLREKKIIVKNKIIKKIPFSDLENKTKKELFLQYKNWQSARSRIQKHARFIFKNSDTKQSCLICDYSLHYEVCHLKSVSEFDENSKIVEDINSLNNLIALCPTHHWEFDNIEEKKLELLSRLGSNQ